MTLAHLSTSKLQQNQKKIWKIVKIGKFGPNPKNCQKARGGDKINRIAI